MNGGGIASNGTVTLTNSNVSENTANYGGGIFVGYSSTATLIGSQVSNNKASMNGGGIVAHRSQVTLTNTIVTKNTANMNGGGIASDGSLIVGGTSQIINNQATTGYGGGIYSVGVPITLDGTGVAVKSNTAHQPASQTSWYEGWGVYLTTGTPILKNGFNPTTQVTGNTHI